MRKARLRKPKRLSRRTIYRDPWINLHVDRVIYPHGRLVPRHHVLDFSREAAGALVLNSRGDVLLIRSYRYVIDDLSWEVPAGRLDKGETVLRAARREIQEETGYASTGHRLLYRYHPMTGLANQVFSIICCQALEKVGAFDRTEVKAVRWFSRTEVRKLIRSHRIVDGFSLTALLFYLNERRSTSLFRPLRGGG